MTISSRAYQDETDYERLRRFLIAIQPLVGTRTYCTIGDLDWWRWTEEDPAVVGATRLWLDATGDVVGFAWPSEESVDIVVHPGHAALFGEMLTWAEERRRATGATGSPLTAWAFETDRARQDVLRRRGYEPTDEAFYLRCRSLADPVGERRLPPGYGLRHVAGEADVEARVAVHRDAFAPSRMTPAKHRAVMSAPTYRPELDLVAVAPDGSFAAFCIAWFDEANRLGLFEPVGTHSAHRRLGLGSAILREGMRRLHALGADTALVASALAEEAANRLYDSVGLTAVDHHRGWKRTL